MAIFANTEEIAPPARIVAGALCFVANVEFFISEAIAAAAWPAYSRAVHEISFLGAVSCGTITERTSGQPFDLCSPRHALMNAGFVLLGLLIFAGAILTSPAWPKGPLSRTGLGLLLLGSAGPILVGLWPLDTNTFLHVGGAALDFLAIGLGIFVLGLAAPPESRLFGAFSMICAALSLSGTALYALGVDLGVGRGFVERVAGYPQTVWFIVTGAILLAVSVRRRSVLAAVGKA